jgi:rSAM/selenodomain-associated transferase 1
VIEPGWQVAVIAKEPVPGAVKTRLCPPLLPGQAATLALAALLDTLAAVATSPARRRVLVLEGRPGDWLPEGFEVVPQRTGDFGSRLQGAVDDTLAGWEAPVLVVGMDTPQLTPAHLERAAEALGRAETVLGPADDGGYWVIGTRCSVPGLFAGVPMSTAGTAAAQLARLDALGLDCALADALRDVDRFDDAVAVAADAPFTRFAAALASFGLPVAPARATTGAGRD